MPPILDIFNTTPTTWGFLAIAVAIAVAIVGPLLRTFGARVWPLILSVLMFAGGVNNALAGFPVAGVICGLFAGVALTYGVTHWSRSKVQVDADGRPEGGLA